MPGTGETGAPLVEIDLWLLQASQLRKERWSGRVERLGAQWSIELSTGELEGTHNSRKGRSQKSFVLVPPLPFGRQSP